HRRGLRAHGNLEPVELRLRVREAVLSFRDVRTGPDQGRVRRQPANRRLGEIVRLFRDGARRGARAARLATAALRAGRIPAGGWEEANAAGRVAHGPRTACTEQQRRRNEEGQPAQHQPDTRGKPPNCPVIRDAPTIRRPPCTRTNTHWSAVGHVTSNQRPFGERITCPKTPVPRKTTRPRKTTSLWPARRRMASRVRGSATVRSVVPDVVS